MEKAVGYGIDFFVLALIYFAFFFRRWRKSGRDKFIANTVMYIYLSFVAYFTLMPVVTNLPYVMNHEYVPMNTELFRDYIAGYGDSERQLILNVLLTVPFGFLLPIVRKKGFFGCLFQTLLLSLSIELIQPLINDARSSDITDVVTNTIGGVVGYLLYRIFRPLIDSIMKSLRRSK